MVPPKHKILLFGLILIISFARISCFGVGRVSIIKDSSSKFNFFPNFLNCSFDL